MFRAFGKPEPYFLAPMYGFYMACPALAIGRTKVLQTWFEGKKVYER